MFKDLLSPQNTFIYGVVLCGIFLVQSLWGHWKTKRELKRYKGMLSDKLDLAPATLSFHLKELSNAGLLKSRQEGRYIYYAADFKAMNALLGYLTENCCGGKPWGVG